MADIQQGLWGLQYSPSFDLQGLQEENVNLTLPPAPSTFATVFGTVTNGTDPLPAATVKLFDSTGLPYPHTIPAADGTYTLDGIPAGTYSVAAVAEGYVMSTAVGVTVSNGSTTEIPLVCTADATLALGAIAGTLTIFGTASTPLGGAKITLTNAALETVATTYTAADGEFLFYDVADGVYTLRASALGYLTTAPMTATILGGSTVNLTMAIPGGQPDLQRHGQRHHHRPKRRGGGGLLCPDGGFCGAFWACTRSAPLATSPPSSSSPPPRPTPRESTCSAASRTASIWPRQR